MVAAVTRMLTFKKQAAEQVESRAERADNGRTSLRPARELWAILMETLDLKQQTVYALSFHRRGSSVYYHHKHFYARAEADRELAALRDDLQMELRAFETKYSLESF